jgi:hypothetical protein
MAEFTQVSSLTGFFYEIYDKIVDPIPTMAKFMAAVPFKGGALEIGNKLHVNVIVSDEGGFTYAARDAGAFTVNAGISFQTQDAQVDAYQLLLQGSVDYESAARASSSRKAFLELVGKKLQVMVASTKRRYESELWYGQHIKGLGVIDTAGVAGQVITLAVGEYAPMLWQGKVGQTIDIWDAAGTTKRAGSPFTIASVNTVNRTITLTGTMTLVAATDVLVWAGSYGTAITTAQAKTCAGVFKIASNLGSLFNIDAAVYDVWAGNSYAVGAKKLTLAVVMQAMAVLANRGLEGDVDLYCSPLTWSTIVTDQAALRRYQGEVVTKQQTGAKVVEFYFQTGKISIIAHGMVKQGYAVIMESKKWKRIGAQDFSFKTPGLEEGRDIFWHSPQNAGFNYRYYGAQALFCEMPSHQMLITGIDNASAT